MNSSTENSRGRIIAALSVAAAIIGIFTFLTGISSIGELSHILGTYKREQPRAATTVQRPTNLERQSAHPQSIEAPADLAVINAIYHRNTETVAALLETGAEVNYLDMDGISPLLAATLARDLILMGLLLDNGADPDHKLRDGDTVLIKASELGYLPEVNVLLNYMSPSSMDKYSQGRNAIMAAVGSGHYALAKLLVEKGAQIDARDPDGQRETPLMVATRTNDLVQVATYVKLGADVTLANLDGLTAVNIARKTQTSHAAETIEKYIQFRDQGRDLRVKKERELDLQAQVILSRSVESGDLGRVAALLEAGIQPRPRDFFSAVENAQTQAGIKIVEALIARDMSLNPRDSSGRTLLMKAAGNLAVMKLLLAVKDADIDAKDNNGMTALMHSLANREELRYLLEAGANVKSKDKRGNTALDYAIDSCFSSSDGEMLEVIEVLIAHGADVRGKDQANCTPLMRLIKGATHKSSCGTSMEVARLLLESGAGEELAESTQRQWAARNSWVTETYQLVLEVQYGGIFPCRKELRELIELHMNHPVGYGWREPTLEEEQHPHSEEAGDE